MGAGGRKLIQQDLFRDFEIDCAGLRSCAVHSTPRSKGDSGLVASFSFYRGEVPCREWHCCSSYGSV